MHYLEKLKPLAQIVLRWALAIVFAFHGYPKLFTQRTQALAMFPKMGFPSYFAYISGSLEFFGGCLLVVGLFTRLVALLLCGEMVVVMSRLSFAHGPLAVANYQLELTLAVAAFTLMTIGGGALSIDRLIFGSKS
jgi:putative oxidoreductase